MAKIYPPVYIAGPTATGKSQLAIDLAQQIPSVIISADSMQIYRGLDIGTAKASKQVRAQFEHKLIDIVDVDKQFSVAEFKQLAQEEISNAQSRGLLPIVVGGTGLYFDSLLYPLSFSNVIKNEDLRLQLRRQYELYGADYLHDKLAALDPKTANRLHKNDVKRVIRALEVVITTGKPMPDSEQTIRPDVIMVGLTADRETLYCRIDDRVDKMFADGLVNEVLSIGNFGYQSMQAIGYKEFDGCNFVRSDDGKFIVDDAQLQQIKQLIKQHTRNYCKRQLTWFKKYDFMRWFDVSATDEAIQYILSQLQLKTADGAQN